MARCDFDFHGAKVLVTGGSSGIGAGIAAAFADAGADVSITGRAADPRAYGSGLAASDYRRYELTEEGAATSLAATFDRLDVLVNNAGASLPDGRDEWTPEVFEHAVRINLIGAYRTAEAFRDVLAESRIEGGASVVNLASMSSYFGMPAVPGYGAAKAAIVQLTKTLAVAWAERGIRVNAVAPGLVRSNMTAAMEEVESAWKPMIDRTPMKRWGEPRDVAPVVLFLCSREARYITGQTLPVDGGYSVA